MNDHRDPVAQAMTGRRSRVRRALARIAAQERTASVDSRGAVLLPEEWDLPATLLPQGNEDQPQRLTAAPVPHEVCTSETT